MGGVRPVRLLGSVGALALELSQIGPPKHMVGEDGVRVHELLHLLTAAGWVSKDAYGEGDAIRRLRRLDSVVFVGIEPGIWYGRTLAVRLINEALTLLLERAVLAGEVDITPGVFVDAFAPESIGNVDFTDPLFRWLLLFSWRAYETDGLHALIRSAFSLDLDGRIEWVYVYQDLLRPMAR